MKCPRCQFENPPGAKFCKECGHDLSLTSGADSAHLSAKSPSFDNKLEKIQRYLPHGLAKKILAQKGKIEGERRLVTVMFCDMEGFTPLVEMLGAEEGYAIMDRVYEILIHNVHKYDGIVNEMTGDGIMALFGVPIALEDAPQRALRSALSIHQEIARFNEQEGKQGPVPPIIMRAGINTGPVVVGTLGNDLRVEFKAVGDTVNCASRMEHLAEPGTTYVTEETFRLAKALFQFEALGEREIKGKKESVPVYKLLSAKKDVYRPRLGSERRIYSEMVGRDRDLAKLELQVMKAINGEGSIVTIVGEAGIGKSRLVAELKKREVMKKVAFFEGRAISIGRNLSFHPIIDLLKHWARIRADDGEAAALGKLETAVRNLYPKKFGEMLPFVATLMGMKLSGGYAERVKGIEGEALENLILKTMRDLLIKASELTPLVIVGEDLHWADTSSIRLMEMLFSLAERKRIVFINVFRSGYKETADRLVQTLEEKFPECYAEILLKPLDERMSEDLIKNMLKIKGLPPAVRDKIVERASGNPFFIEEVVQSLIDLEAVALRHGVFEVTEKIEAVRIPPTINDVVMARIDVLEEETRYLLKIASVIGRNFFHRILTEVAGTVEDIDSRLSSLKKVQLIRRRRRMGEIEYLFKHALVQEAAYESILHQKRKEIHLKVAESIEKVFSQRLQEFYGMLAYHYGRGENVEKTEAYLIKAGEEALRSSASSEALNYYQGGLKLYLQKYGDAADPEKLATFEKNIATAFFNKGQYEKASEYFDRVLDIWGAKLPKNRLTTGLKVVYDLLNVIAHLYLPLRKAKKAPDERHNEICQLSYKRAMALVHSDPKRCFIEFIDTIKRLNRFDITRTENGLGMWMSASGLFSWGGISFKLSKRILQYNEDKIDKNNLKQVFYYDLFELLHNCFSGNWSSIKEYDEELAINNLRMGESWHVLNYLLFHGNIKIDQGNFDDAETKMDKALEIWEAYGNENAIAIQHFLKLRLLAVLRKLYDAQLEADAGIAFHQSQTGREQSILHYFGYKAIIQTLQKNIHGAKESLLLAKELLVKQGRGPPIYISSYLVGKFLFDLHLLEQAVLSNKKSDTLKYRKKAYRSGRQALRNSRKYAFDRTEVIRLMGVYFWLIGSQEEAARFWNHSVKEAERLGARVELARTYGEIGRRLTEKKSRLSELNGIKAEEYLDKAGLMFEEMNLRWDLDELNRIPADR